MEAMSLKQFEHLAHIAGVKEDGSFSAKRQRDFLRQYYSSAATGEVAKTYLQSCLLGCIVPEISDDNLKGFRHWEINPLVKAGVVPAQYEIKPHGTMGEFFGATDEESF